MNSTEKNRPVNFKNIIVNAAIFILVILIITFYVMCYHHIFN
ncbi:hypothetical protein IQ02_00014 [Flavobacterium glaciei]|uniref:Uncharacterized protein n=1 Tax=Flavobacterium glaciei TaxID=386300 RepID=A0A562Q559_9FLAO|nr:hypothetical protein DFR66_10114 [Flavobacterium glaciei]TWI51887.1 hypothetical protein IQ02_00014 [Flavobacterium glaciei]